MGAPRRGTMLPSLLNTSHHAEPPAEGRSGSVPAQRPSGRAASQTEISVL